MNQIPKWRLAVALSMLGALIFFGAVFTPIYLRNMKLQSFVASLPQSVEDQAKSGLAPTDAQVRESVVAKARELGLPVEMGDVAITRSPAENRLEAVNVHYMVRVDLPGYTVNLHFYPGAGSR